MKKNHVLSIASATLGSSCCVIQLALNAFGMGCAGFAALTPYQPLFVSLTIGSLGYSFFRNRSWKTVIVFLGSMLILGSPYLVAEVNKSVKNVGSEMIMCEVKGVKCEGCLNDVKNRLSKIENITGVSIQFKSEKDQLANVTVYSTWPILETTLQKALKSGHSLTVVDRVSGVNTEELQMNENTLKYNIVAACITTMVLILTLNMRKARNVHSRTPIPPRRATPTK